MKVCVIGKIVLTTDMCIKSQRHMTRGNSKKTKSIHIQNTYSTQISPISPAGVEQSYQRGDKVNHSPNFAKTTSARYIKASFQSQSFYLHFCDQN